MATIRGTNGDDDLRGRNAEDDLIVGGDGDDSLRGFSGDDTLDGGAGADFFDAGRGDDRIEAVEDGDFAFFARRDGNDTIGSFAQGGVLELRDIAPEDVRIEAITVGGANGAFITTGRGLTLRIEDLGDATAADLVLTRIDNADDDTIITLNEAFEVPTPEPVPVDGLIGTDGDDVLIDQSRDLNVRGQGETFRGLGGNDVISAFGGFASISGDGGAPGTDGNDTITADFIGNRISAGGGDDAVTLSNIAPEGFDPSSVLESIDQNEVRLEDGDDVGTGGFFSDVFFGGEGNDRIDGRGGDDFLFGQDGNDDLLGDAGDDFLSGGAGDDQLRGGGGADTFEGGSGADRLFGGGGDDVFREGSDSQRDVIEGGDGDDTVILGNNRSSDIVTLGSGADAVVLGPDEDSRAATDTVRDFAAGEDVIDLSNFFTISGGGTTTATSFDPSGFFFLIEEDGGTTVAVVEQDPAPTTARRFVLDPDDATFREAVFLEGVDASELGAGDFFLGDPAEADFGAFVPDVATADELGLG